MKFRPIQNNNSKLKIASSPFTHNQQSTSQVMLWVILAAIPGILCQLYFFGLGTLYQIILAIIVALLAETICVKLRKEDPLLYLKDNSALLTGILLAISIPPLAPWWIIVLGTFFAVVIAKHIYGGLGQNPFNPAMVGYVVLLISFPVQMTSWMPPIELQAVSYNFIDSLSIFFTGHTPSGLTLEDLRRSVDGITQATPLDSFKTGLLTHSIDEVLVTPILQGGFAGMGWQWVNVAYLVGGVILLYKRIISWQIPVAMLTLLGVCSLISWGIDATRYSQPLLQLFSGATMLGAFFIATDPVSASTTPKGRLIYGAIIGLLVWIIRVYGGYPDAVAFSVLLANIAVPLIDSYTRPRVYGH
ncbi:electron transport complex subunit RsxD [Proteus mirabilis]|uniref:electron transport complex subunit RsxD n=1 Tax=Proteus mirabilis TaxID=584 RepID=UPI0015824292|nr:electron transport complex subunit RsxD [Proteus mirabilis]MBG2815504.1 electron transport complex subunit RsxD [Proteus mirabilis]MBG2864150.1 electron transport complex subunit RsxD [Proteus mirabilis]MBL1398035.1 electron transport complex subunit RsxD [Proteus mirabilis]MCL8564772.1 electron transport complex subunit RsxD [Proteus mirabilis]MCL8625961.1 electron transport complex subunit RsxD [Proteus mirabilis]